MTPSAVKLVTSKLAVIEKDAKVEKAADTDFQAEAKADSIRKSLKL